MTRTVVGTVICPVIRALPRSLALVARSSLSGGAVADASAG